MLYSRADTPRALWAVPIAGGEPWKIAADCGYAARVSPDSRMVACFVVPEVEGTSPTTCVVAPIEGGAPIATFTWPTRSSAPKWTPDGKGLSFLAEDNVANLFVQPLAGGPARPLTRLTEGPIGDYLWSPDGKRVVLHRYLDNVSNLWSAGTDGRAPRSPGSVPAHGSAAELRTRGQVPTRVAGLPRHHVHQYE